MLETESTVTGTVIKNEQVTNLPLNTRQFMQMVFLSPFSIPASRDFRSTEVNRDTAVASGGGGRPEDNNYQIDGFDNQEIGAKRLFGCPADRLDRGVQGAGGHGIVGIRPRLRNHDQRRHEGRNQRAAWDRL